VVLRVLEERFVWSVLAPDLGHGPDEVASERITYADVNTFV
jgi:hypothetical protein